MMEPTKMAMAGAFGSYFLFLTSRAYATTASRQRKSPLFAKDAKSRPS
jgi:hypothetical protein